MENSSKLVKITGILEGLKDMNASQMSLEEYMNYMGPIWELNQKYRSAIDELEDLQFCLQVLGIMFAGMGMIHALTSTAIIDTVLDVIDTGISFVLGDYAGFAIGGISILLPEIFESGLKTAKKTLKSGDDILEVLSKKEKQALLDKLDEAGITNVTKVEMGSDGVKIHSASGVIDAKWTDEVVEGASNLISEADRLKLSKWTNAPSDELCLANKSVFDNDIYYDQATGKTKWPGQYGDVNIDGFVNGQYDDVVLTKGMEIDRYGGDNGTFFAENGISIPERAMAPNSDFSRYNIYEVKGDIPVRKGTIASWFDQPGGGIQYQIDPVFVESIKSKLNPGESFIDGLIRLRYLVRK